METLVQDIPELKPVYDEHIDDNDELLTHVFMADIVRFVEQLYDKDPKLCMPCEDI